ncbi:DUF503 domain-containing protein [Dictyobacter kobayashii]|uniref:DUF503 domain-containing protein n=1 Tax=Dictyobacter kobayashii TaxID=2014872 RepID=A0A402AFY8_9CHLR|nr:DUF503 domain-containing protein [Dictyobacter kobayashii]GCE17974.1 hypothetical protein KDK_17740 [Dictyobacter kobayashii]
MVIAAAEITLHLPACHSLKDKRQIIKSIMARVRNQFEVAIAEVGDNDLWQSAKIGLSHVSNSSQHADEVLSHIRRYIEETRPDIVISAFEKEIIHW